MRVEFLTNTEINDGRQIFIEASEFIKAKKDDEDFNSFAFATHALFSFYSRDDFIQRHAYERVLEMLGKNGAVIITVIEEKYPRRVFPEVYVSNNNRLKMVELF